MTEVTRIACPGCRSLLRFEPEALDFPADCGGCDCRFSVGIYVKIACPSCQCSSKIREKYLAQRVRCVRCSHPFLASEGIPQGGGGRLLVARMLDTDLPNPPETIQPFLGHARDEYDRRASSAANSPASPPSSPAPRPAASPRNQEASRASAEIVAERDRLVQEAGLYKSILSKLVSSPTGEVDPAADPTIHESLATLGVSMAPGLPASARAQQEAAIWRANEEKNRAEAKLKKQLEELETANAHIRKHQAELDAANAEIRKHQALVAERETLIDLANREREFTEQKLKALRGELTQAKAEAEEHKNRLAGEADEARQTAEALSRRLQETEAKLQELSHSYDEVVRKEASLVLEHTRSLEESERQRTALSITVARLTQAVLSARAGEYEALDRLEEYASNLVEADAALRAELNTERQRGLELDLIVKELQADIEAIRMENLANTRARDAEINDLRRRFAEERRALMAELTQTREEAADGIRKIEENRRLVEANERLQAENTKLAASGGGTGASHRIDPTLPPNKRLAEALEQNEMLHLDNVRLGRLVETSKAEADRRQKSLVLEVQRIKAEYEKLSASNEQLIDRVQELLAEKMLAAESAQSSNGVRSSGPASTGSALDSSSQPLSVAQRSSEAELHRDIAFTMLYGDTTIEKRSTKNGH